MVLVKLDYTAWLQKIVYIFLQWGTQAYDIINFKPQMVFNLCKHLNFFFFKERCDKEFHFAADRRCVPLQIGNTTPKYIS